MPPPSDPRSLAAVPRPLLDLPAELRNQIYEDVFEDLVAPSKHPWDPQPTNSRFEQYVDLLLTCRQVNTEAASIFVKDYSQRVVFYFTNSVELFDLYGDWNPSHPIIGNVRSSLLTRLDLDRPNHEWELRAANEPLWEQQPGFVRSWTLDHPRYYHVPGTQRHPPWLPRDHGFQLVSGEHSLCAQSAEGCIPYRTLKWPRLGNGCSLTTCSWRAVPRYFNGSPGQPQDLGCMTFEGRLADVNFGNHKAALAHTRVEDCDYEICHTCDCHTQNMDECDLRHPSDGWWENCDGDEDVTMTVSNDTGEGDGGSEEDE